MSKLGKKLIEATKEAVRIARGEADPASYKVHVQADVEKIRNDRSPQGKAAVLDR